MKGYTGKVLVINLSSGTWETEQIEDNIYKQILSGVGLGVWYLYNNIPEGADALGPDNILGFTSGILTGTGSVMNGRWMAVCKSPLTGGWGDSNCGGNLAPAIKQAGYDAIFFKGKADKPIYVYIDDDGPQIRDAAPYWGMDAVEAEETLIKENSGKRKPRVAVIGPGGEKQSLISGISNDMGRYAARSGVGAVMGSKKLKAIVLAGTKKTSVVNPEEIKRISKEYAQKVKKAKLPGVVKGSMLPIMGKVMGSMKKSAPMDGMLSAMLIKKYGSIMNNTMSIPMGDAPLKNWGGSEKDFNHSYYKHLNPDKFLKDEKKKYHCNACIVGCGGIMDIEEASGGKYKHTHKPEYETVMAFGGLLMNKDRDTIYIINEIINRAGYDTISVGGTVAFAIECFENGILTVKDTDGLKLSWGDSEAILKLTELIVKREGIGDILADGVKKAAERIGKGSEKYAVHAGGQELPMHDPKIDPMMGVAYSADPTPGRHTTSGGTYYTMSALWEKVSWLPPFKKHPKSEDYEPSELEAMKNRAYTSMKMIVDGVGGCYYAMLMGVEHYQVFESLNAATGWCNTADDYMEIGRRIQTIRQLFNVKHGVDLKSVKMHGRALGKPPLKEGHNKNITLRTDEMIPLYWKAWGWDEHTGVPLKETILELGLNNLLNENDHE